MAHAPQSPRELRAVRTIAALVLREMGTTHGRAIGGSTYDEPFGPVTRALIDGYKELVGFDFEQQYLQPPQPS